MTYTPTLGQDALMVVTVVREEHSEDGVTGVDEYIVECPNGTETIATSGHLMPRLSATEWKAIEVLVQGVGGLPITALTPQMRVAFQLLRDLRDRQGWA
jgi:hypothetical protein